MSDIGIGRYIHAKSYPADHLVFNRDPRETRLSCVICEESLLIDYIGMGVDVMGIRLGEFMARHRYCKLERGIASLVRCINHGDDQACELCRDDEKGKGKGSKNGSTDPH